MRLLNRLFKPAPKPRRTFVAPAFAPEAPFYAIGDIHGRADLLKRLLDLIAAEDTGAQIVCVGDYVDRGENSADVLRHLIGIAQNDGVICLMGNHEEMMLRFLDDPAEHGNRWLRYGGLQTLASFNIGGVSERSNEDALRTAAQKLRAALGTEQESWLRGLPRQWQSGNIAVVHAAADPERPIAEQDAEVLSWGHADFLNVPREDGVWVVHGHTILPEPSVQDGRIGLDTGAYATGVLTAAHVSDQGARFITA